MSTYAVVNPATGETIKEYAEIGDEELRAAIGRADEAARTWGSSSSVAERAGLVRKVGDTKLASAQIQKAYRALFDEPVDGEFVEALRLATNGGWALGSERFKRRIADAAGRRVTPLPRGRPRKTAKPPKDKVPARAKR